MTATTGVLTIYRTTIGQKVIMASTGLILVGFVFFHMIGNLKIYFGAYDYNEYSHFLREVGYPLFPEQTLLWIARIILLVAVVAHIWAAVSLTRKDLDSRPVNYSVHKRQTSSYASRTMRYGGAIIFFFILYHILHLTFGYTLPNYVEGSVYNNVINGFRNPIVSVVYILANIFVALHIYHGTWSLMQTLGTNGRRFTNGIRIVAGAVALLILVGNLSIPIAVLSGMLQLA